MNADDLSGIGSAAATEVDPKEMWRMQNLWLEAFAWKYKAKHGAWNRPYVWEYFSENEKTFGGANAIERYRAKSSTGFYVWLLEDDAGEKLFKCEGPNPGIEKLMTAFENQEVCVFDSRLDWCAFFTHEDGYLFDPPGLCERED
jgi:hypothetical protein